MDENFNLDISWLESLSQMDNHSKEPMETISISFVYINSQNEIHKKIKENHDLEIDLNEDSDGDSLLRGDSLLQDPFLSKESLMSLVSSKKKFENNHYKLVDILLFNVDLDSSDISSLSSYSFIHKLSILEDIVVPCSLPVFHSTNGLFLIFKEISPVKKPSLIISQSLSADFPLDKVISSNITHKRRSLVKYTRKNKK